MNYKILAGSIVVSIAILTITIQQTTKHEIAEPARESAMALDLGPPMRSTTVDIEEPAPRPAIMTANEPRTLAPSGSEAAAVNKNLRNLDDIPGLPQVAYIYRYGFRLPGDGIKPLQEAHADMCEAKGPNVCRIMAMDQSEDESGYATGTLHIAVAAPIARSFGKELTMRADGAEAELVASAIEGDDLSKSIVDTEARLRARTVLRDRLMDVLRNRRGTVAELVEAERGVAAVNEEIDQATSWLAEMKARVAFSQVHLSYATGSPVAKSSGFADPVMSALAATGSTLGAILGFLIRLATVLLPIALLAWLAVRLWRLAGRPGRKLWDPPAQPEAVS